MYVVNGNVPACYQPPADRPVDVDIIGLTSLVRHVLMELAHEEDGIASSEAAQVPYWSSLPASVSRHRAAASALRDDAAALDPAHLQRLLGRTA